MDTREALASNPLYASLWTVRNPSCHGIDARRERQLYTDWINGQLTGRDDGRPEISDLEQSLSDGTTLCRLSEVLTNQKPDWPHRKPALVPHRLDNIRTCLEQLAMVGVDMTGIFAEDVVHADPKTALALICAIYSRFHANHQMTNLFTHTVSSPTQSQLDFNSTRLGDSQYLSSSFNSSSTWATASPVPIATGDDSNLSRLRFNSSRLALNLNPSSSWANAPSVPIATRTDANASQLFSNTLGHGDSRNLSSVSTSSSWAAASSILIATKDDIALFSWVERLLGVHVGDCSQLRDGIMLCALVNQLCPGTITQQQVLSSNPSQRLALAVAVAHRLLGAPPTPDVAIMSSVLGREEVKKYLAALRLAHERAFMNQLHSQFGCIKTDQSPEREGWRDSPDSVNR